MQWPMVNLLFTDSEMRASGEERLTSELND